MKQSNLKLKKDPKKYKKQKAKLVIQEEPDSKFKNEIFQKLYDRNNASKDRFNTIGSENSRTRKNEHSPRSNSNLKENKSQKRLKSSKKKNNLERNESGAKSKKVYRNPYDGRKFKDYPNLIGGVLNQVNYYNINNNNNYNDYLRYRPIDDIFNEQSSISTKKEKDNNNSPNISFNSENQKLNNENNIRKIKIEEDINNDNLYNNDTHNEMKENEDNLKFRKSDIIEKNGKRISPIISETNSNDIYYKKETNDDKNDLNNKVEQVINDKIEENIKEPKNEDNLINKNTINNKIKNIENTNNTPSQFNVEQIEKEESKITPEQLIKEKINLMSIENNNNFMIDNDLDNYINKLEKCPIDIFSIYNNKINIFDELEIIKDNDINLIYEKEKEPNQEIKEINEDDGKLRFDNDDEVLNYIKKRIKEEKDQEYNRGKTKYNYFILTKKFHGKVLYEIGLENNLENINSILQKENVEIEHEPIVFIKIKDLELLKSNKSQENNKETEDNSEEIEKFKIENEKLKTKLELINKNYEEKNAELINEYNKIYAEIEKLNSINQQLENELINKQNIINQYEAKFEEYSKIVEDNNRLQIEREKFTKYIYELQEYDEKVIIEYKKIKQQLEIEKSKNKSDNNEQNTNKYFDLNELEIIQNDLFGIISSGQTNKIKNVNYEIERMSQQIILTKNENKDQDIQINNIEENNRDYYGENIYEENKNNLENETEAINRENEIDSNVNKEEIIEKKDEKEEKINERSSFENKEIINNNENPEPEIKKKNKVTFGIKDIQNREDIKKRDESLSRAMQRITNKRRLDKMKENENKFRKSKKIEGMAGNLEDKLKGKEGRIYVDLDYEKNKSEEEEF